MKHSAQKKNPVLQPIPLAAMIISTLATLGVGIFTVPTILKTPETKRVHRTRYQCESCGLANVFSNALDHPVSFNKDNSANFKPVILAIHQGRYRHNIETERLLLREVTLNDVPVLDKYYRKIENEASSTWNLHTAEEETRKEVLEMIENYRTGKRAHWAICEKKSGTIMGLGGFNSFSPIDHRANIGWWLDASFWGQGYGTEMARACIEYGIKYLNLNRLDAIVRVDNLASRKVLEKAGMSATSQLRQFWRLKGELLSFYQYVVLKKDVAEQLKKSKV